MISDLEFESFDAEVDQLFRDANAESIERGDPVVLPDEERVERIVEKARHEAVIKDSTTFFFRSFTAAIAELLVALLRTFLPDRRELDGEGSDGPPGSPLSPPDSDSLSQPTNKRWH